jgi:hypothetical protein
MRSWLHHAGRFKKPSCVTDVAGVNETERSGPPTDVVVDNEPPKLSGTPMLPNVAPVAAPLLDATPSLPLVSPVLSNDALPMLPTLPSPAAKTPSAELHLPPALIDEVVASGPEERRHPMAHLMPGVHKPSEAALRAAAARAVRKRKARRNKVIGGVAFVAVAAVAGPPAAKWTIDAINEAGKTKPDTPADSVPGTTLPEIEAMLTTPPTSLPAPSTTPAP